MCPIEASSPSRGSPLAGAAADDVTLADGKIRVSEAELMRAA